MIRLANKRDILKLKMIYSHGRALIKSYQSPQWQNNYPSDEIIESDINNKALYVYEDNDDILAAMTVFDYEQTYEYIEGKWLSNLPYLVIHRIATHQDHYRKGLSEKLIQFCFDELKTKSIRIDTHELNFPMQNLLKKLGFSYCGIIYLNQQTDRVRLAYQKDI